MNTKYSRKYRDIGWERMKNKEYKVVSWKDATFSAKYVTFAWLLIPLVALLCVWYKASIDSDSFFLRATGKYILEHREVPKINPFTFHEDFKIIIQQWVVDVINYLLYDNFGVTGMYAWTIIMFIAVSFMCYKYLGMYTDNNKAKIYGLLFSVCIIYGFVNTRPSIITMVILLCELTILEMVCKGKSKRLLCIIPILSIVGINCHSSMWPMVIIVMLPYVFPPLPYFKSVLKIKEYLLEHKEIWLTMIVSFLVGFLNPNGIDGMAYVFLSYSNASTENNIAELRSPKWFSYFGIIIMICTLGIAFWTYKNKDSLDWKSLYLALGTWLLAIKNLRSAWMLILGAVPLLVTLIDESVKNSIKIKHTDSNYRILALIYTFGAVVIFGTIVPGIKPNFTEDTIISPVKAVDYLDSLSDKEKENLVIFNSLVNGGYLEWRGYKTYIDQRPELYCKEINGKADIYNEYLDVKNGRIDFQKFLDKYGFNYLIVLNYEDGFQTYLECSNKYEVVVEADQYKGFKKI